jgi:hypothetical protein
MPGHTNVHKSQTCDQFRPILKHAVEEFGPHKVVEVAFQSPIAEQGRFYKDAHIALTGLNAFFRDSSRRNFNWSTLKAYDWALRHLYPYAKPMPIQERITQHRLDPTKKEGANVAPEPVEREQVAEPPAPVESQEESARRAARVALDRGQAAPAAVPMPPADNPALERHLEQLSELAGVPRPVSWDPTDIAIDLLAEGDWIGLAKFALAQVKGDRE